MAMIFLLGSHLVKADLVFDSGYNTFDDDDPYYAEVWVINYAQLDVLGGEMGKLEFQDSSIGNIFGGEIGGLWTGNNVVVNIYGGTLNELACFPDSLVYLFAYDVTFHPPDGAHNDPWLEGKYLNDGTLFSFEFYDDDCIPQLHVVPEPMTLLLLGLGGLLIRNRN